MTGERRTERGFSLAEVVVALGVLASVLISVAGLLVLGHRLVKAGRGNSEALAVARDVLEEMECWSFEQVYTTFACDPAQPTCSASTDDSPMAQWRDVLEDNLHQARAEVLIESLEQGSPALADTRGIRITVTVRWQEGPRTRSTELTTVRL